ncbi:MAG: hypothetical protein EBR09_02515 [Proteobacteria bacterium]|nr:hypothetical protein [Pseudomonadota bacterium]
MAVADGKVVPMTLKAAKKIIVTDGECASALACVRSLGMSGYDVCLVSHAERPAAAASRFVRKFVRVASPWNEARDYRGQLAEISRGFGADFILPVSDASVFALSEPEYADSFGSRLLLPSKDLLGLGMSKIRTYRRALESSVPVAAGDVVTPDDNDALSAPLAYPLIVRTDNHACKDGRFHKGQTWIVHSAEEFKCVRREQQSLGQRMLVQRYVAGHGRGCFLLVWEGKVVCWHTHQRLAEIPWQGGVSARRQIGFDHDLLQSSVQLLGGLRISGILMVEFRQTEIVSATTGGAQLLLVEVNARPWGSMALAVNANVPFIVRWLDLLNGSPADLNPWEGKEGFGSAARKKVCTTVYPGEFQHLLSVFRSAKRSELKASDALGYLSRSLSCVFSKVTAFDYFRSDDPRPACRMLKRAVSQTLHRLTKLFCERACSGIFRLFCRLRGQPVKFKKNAVKTNQFRVLVICHGNRCRSPFFEALLKQKLRGLPVEVISRGLEVSDTNVPPRFHDVFRSHGVEPNLHASLQVTQHDVRNSDVIVVMEGMHAFAILRRFGLRAFARCTLLQVQKTIFTEVSDPFLRGPAAAAVVFEQLSALASGFSDQIVSLFSRPCASQAPQKTDP